MARTEFLADGATASRASSGSRSWRRGRGRGSGTCRRTTSTCRSRPTWTGLGPACGPPDRCCARPPTSSATSRSASSSATPTASCSRRRTGDSRLEGHLDRVWLAPGFSYAEEHVGTNGIGTALEGGGPARVFGHEHYVEHLEELACAGVPIRHPVTGKVLGVIDLTCWRRDAGTMMVAAATALSRRIEAMLLEQSGRRELALLHDYLTACRRNRDAVLAVGDDLLMLNDRARELLAPADQGPLLAEATEALGHRPTPAAAGRPAERADRAGAVPAELQRGRIGRAGSSRSSSSARCRRQRARGTAPPPALPTAVGSGTLWTKCCQAVDRHFRAREWLVLEGEPGTGKTTLARAAHQSRTPAAHLRVFDANDAQAALGRGRDRRAAPPAAGRSCSPTSTGCRRTRWACSSTCSSPTASRPTSTGPGSSPPSARSGATATPDLATLLSLFPRTVEVPPLRHHVEDVAELVPHLLARLTRGGTLAVSPAVMRVLMRNRWPGNVEQLFQVLRTTVARRRTGVDRAGRPAAGVPGHHPSGAHAARVDRVRRHRGRAARHGRQQGGGGPAAGHVPGDDLPQDPRVRSVAAGRQRLSTQLRGRGARAVNPAARASSSVRNHTSARTRV